MYAVTNTRSRRKEKSSAEKERLRSDEHATRASKL